MDTKTYRLLRRLDRHPRSVTLDRYLAGGLAISPDEDRLVRDKLLEVGRADGILRVELRTTPLGGRMVAAERRRRRDTWRKLWGVLLGAAAGALVAELVKFALDRYAH